MLAPEKKLQEFRSGDLFLEIAEYFREHVSFCATGKSHPKKRRFPTCIPRKLSGLHRRFPIGSRTEPFSKWCRWLRSRQAGSPAIRQIGNLHYSRTTQK